MSTESTATATTIIYPEYKGPVVLLVRKETPREGGEWVCAAYPSPRTGGERAVFMIFGGVGDGDVGKDGVLKLGIESARQKGLEVVDQIVPN